MTGTQCADRIRTAQDGRRSGGDDGIRRNRRGCEWPDIPLHEAIGTEQVCLNCHAAEIKPDVEKLLQLYPQDTARGFAVGDIRGAFTLSKPL